MKVLISGQAGLAIFVDNTGSWVVSAERPDERLPCLNSDIAWLLADVVDIKEFEDTTYDDAVKELRRVSRADRALQLVLILLDGDEDSETAWMAAEVLDGWLKDEPVVRFVENRLYAAHLPHNADVPRAKEIARKAGEKVFDFLVALDNHQGAIRTTRETWDTLSSDLFREITEDQEIKGSRTESFRSEKQVFERIAVKSGLFRYFARSIQTGAEPDEQRALAEFVHEGGLQKYRTILSPIVRAWGQAALPSYRAMIAVQLLAIAECLRLKRYAKALVVGLGIKAHRQDYRGLLREAVRLTVESGSIGEGRDLEESMVNSMRTIARRWWESASPGEQADSSQSAVWEAVEALKRPELLRLHRYSRWRIRWLGRKALGRDERDLLDEAITATLSGKRAWTGAVPLRQHLLGAMRSISTSWHERKVEEYLESELVEPSTESPLDRLATTQDPEKILEAKERLNQIRKLFEHDTIASEVLDLLGFGYTAKEIQSRIRISSAEFAAAAKRIRRKLDSWHRSQEAG
jgi:hypothetical protein